MNSRNDFLSYAELCAKYNYRFQIMQYNSLLPAITWKKRIKEHVESPSKLEGELYETRATLSVA